MGFDNDCILNIQSLAGEYFCPVCHLLVYPNEALQTQCTHLYCKPCLTYVVSSTHACPYDGYRVTEADSKPLLESNKALADTIWKIQVHCLYYRTGCTWQGLLSDSTSHCSTCAFGESPVQCNRCGVQIVHRQVQEHALNCPGAQPVTGQNATSTGPGTVPNQGQTANQTVAPASQIQGTEAIASSSSTQDTNQQANSTLQPQPVQAALPTPEQWYQQQQQYQQQYQQYYQQYPGYDPYQQQYYYQYPQAGQQSHQPAMQTYTSHAYGQAQLQSQPQAQQQGQSHVQPRSQLQTQTPSLAVQLQVQPQAQLAVNAQPQLAVNAQPQVQPQAQPAVNAQPQVQPQAQPTANAQPQVQSAVQAQSQMQGHNQGPPLNALPYNQSQPLPQGQPYVHQQPVLQQTPVPQYQHSHSQMQLPYPQPYPQSQTQHYPYVQPQAQPHSQPTAQAAAYPTSQGSHPLSTNAQLQAQGAVTGFQSYPQPQLHPQAQVGAGQMPSGQMQGQFPPQSSQIRPLQPYGVVANQQQSTMLSAQGKAPTGPPAQQLPVYPHAQQAGYPFHQHPGVQAAQQAPPQQYMQQQSLPGQGPFMQAQLYPQGPSQIQPQPPPPPQHQQNCAPLHSTQPNMTQSYAGKQRISLGDGSQSYAQGAGSVGPGYVRSTQSQTYPMGTNGQLATSSEQLASHAPNSLKTASGERSHDQMVEKGDQNQNDREDARVVAGSSAAGSQVDEMNKVKSEKSLKETIDGNEIERDMSSADELPGSKQQLGTLSMCVETGVQECKPGTNGNTAGEISEPSSGDGTKKSGFEDGKDAKKSERQDLKHLDRGKVAASASKSHSIPQVPGSNSFPLIDHGVNQLQPTYYGSSAQQRPGLSSIPQSMHHPGNSQQPGLRGNFSNQLRPQAPGQVPSWPPFHAADTPTSLKNPPGAVPNEKPPVGVHGPGSSGAVGRPVSVGHYQSHLPPYQAGQPQNPQGETFPESSIAAHRPSAFDSHGSMVGRESLPRSAAQQHPPYQPGLEKFPVQRPGYFDNRLPDCHPHAPMEQGPYGPVHPGVQPGAVKFSGPLSHDPMHAPGMHAERYRPFPEEHLKPFPHQEYEDDFRMRPPHLEAGPRKFGTHFPPSRPLDQVPHHFGVDGISRPFEKDPRGHERDSGLKMDSGPSSFLPSLHPIDVNERPRLVGFPDDIGRPDFVRRAGPGFGQHCLDGLPPRSPGRDYAGFPSRSFGGYRDIDGNEPRSFEGSKPYSFRGETLGKSAHESRPHNQDMLHGHLRRGEHIGPHNFHLGEGAAFGRSSGPSRIGERPLVGNMPQHLPFGDFFGEKPGHSLVGEPGYSGSYSFQRYARDGGFYLGEMEPFDNPRKRKPGSIMCRICKVECGTVEGLDLHSQSKEHQRKAMDMVLSIKHQNKKKKTSKDQASIEVGRDGGKPKASSFESRGNKR